MLSEVGFWMDMLRSNMPHVNIVERADRSVFEQLVRTTELLSFVANVTQGMSQGSVQSYRKRLIEAGVVISPRRGELCFVVPMLADYLKQREARST